LFASASHATTWFVQSGGPQLAFNPQTLTIQPGDTVSFSNLGGFHNVVADDGSFRCARGCDGDGNNGNGNASSAIWRASVTFPRAGKFGYFCEPHGGPGAGMFGTIIVAAPQPVPIDPSGGAMFAAVLAGLLALVAMRRLAR
jgi:plastocyanin